MPGRMLVLQQQAGNQAVTAAVQRRLAAAPTILQRLDAGPDAAVEVSSTLAPFLPAALAGSAADVVRALGSSATAGAAVQALRRAGLRDPNKLTNLVFWAHHPEAAGRKLEAGERELAQEWIRLRDAVVMPALAGGSEVGEAAPGTGLSGGTTSTPAPGPGPAGAPKAAKVSDLPLPPTDTASMASSLATKQKAGGMTVAMYAGKAVKSHREFEYQGQQFARDHGAIGVQGGRLAEGVAMPLEVSSAALLDKTSRGVQQVLSAHPEVTAGAGPTVPVDELAIFTHGGKGGLNVLPADGWLWSKGVDRWVEGVAPYLSASPRIMLYACSTAGTRPKAIPFAEALRLSIDKHLRRLHGEGPEVGSEVWGHQTVGHTTANRLLSVFKEGLGSSGTSLNGALGVKMAALAAEIADRTDLAEKAAARLAASGQAHMEAVLQAYRGGKKAASATGSTDPLNVLAREAGNIGIERMWLGITTTDPIDLTDVGLTAPARERVEQGFAEVRVRFRHRLGQLVKEAATVKG